MQCVCGIIGIENIEVYLENQSFQLKNAVIFDKLEIQFHYVINYICIDANIHITIYSYHRVTPDFIHISILSSECL